MTLIQDITPPEQLNFDTKKAQPAIKRLSSDSLIAELWRRGVPIQTIFGHYYALEAIEDAKFTEVFGSDEEGQHGRLSLTVDDAQLIVPVHINLSKKPF